MEQANKLFRGCPYEEQEFFGCAQCPQYQRCLEMKKRRKKRKVKYYVLNTIIPTGMMMITAITAVILLVICVGAHHDQEVPVGKTEDTAEQITEETLCTVNQLTEETTIPVIEEPTEEQTIPNEESAPKEEVEAAVPEEPIQKKLSADGPGETYYYNVSEEEKSLMAKLVWKESRGEPLEGKVAVAAVVLNRYYYGEDKDFDRESIESVITQPGQFASIKNVTMADLDLVPECMVAVEAACKGWDPTREYFKEGALYFFAHDKVSGYQKEIREGLKIMVIENHSFHFDFEK